ncbi:MAG: DNA primase [Patescibacteria group bacterium]|nr:DNA primase [Patescibacteria group bacterium]
MLNSPVDEIKQRLDIVDVLSEYLSMKKLGGNYKALCPFHNEKTPSFMVSQEKQIFHCFGCDKGGDMFEFIKEIEGVEFPEALRILAKKANVTLTRQNPELEDRKTRILDILKDSCEFFQKNLESEAGKIAQDYLKERELKEDTIDEFKLGYSLDDWEKLNQHLLLKGYKEEEIFQAGMTIKSEKRSGYYDRFRGRLMFPICDVHGSVVGFTARKLKEDEADKTGKYINTPQTLVYDKSRVIYGLDKAKQNIKKLGATIMVEGNMDVISAHQAGFSNVVASSGTALTEEQVNLLKRYSPNIIIAFDMDEAGAEAAKRGIDVAMQKEMNIKVLTLPEGAKDPDDLIKKDPVLFKEAVKNSQNIMDFYFASAIKDKNISDVNDKKKIARELLPILTKIGDSIEQTHYLQKLSELINVPEDVLRKKIVPFKSGVAGQKEPDSPEKEKTAISDRYEKLSKRVVALITYKNKDIKYFIDYLDVEYLVGDEIIDLYKNIVIYYNKQEQFNVEDFVEQYPELKKRIEILSLFGEGQFSNISENDLQKEVVSSIRDLEKNYIQKRIISIQKEISEMEKTGSSGQVPDPAMAGNERIEELSREFNLLTQKLMNIS